jgi:hypothetical protein
MQRYEPETMDHTATKSYKDCPRKYFYSKVLGRQPVEGKWESVFAFGSMIHKYLEVLYEKGDAGAAAVEALKLWRSPTNPKFDYQTKERAVEAFGALYKMYLDEKKSGNIEVLAIEQPWNMLLPDGVAIGGRFDQYVKWNGRIWNRDWKTTSKQMNYFKPTLEPNDQVIRYIFGLSALQFGVDEHGVPKKVVDGALFVAVYNTKTIKNEIIPCPTGRNLSQLKEWMNEQMFIHKQMEANRETDIWPKHEVNCTFCDYRAVCNAPSLGAAENLLKTAYLLRPWKMEETEQKVEKDG